MVEAQSTFTFYVERIGSFEAAMQNEFQPFFFTILRNLPEYILSLEIVMGFPPLRAMGLGK